VPPSRFKLAGMPSKVLLLRDVNLNAVIKAVFTVAVLIDLGHTSCLEGKLPKPNFPFALTKHLG
jgi:hypothetical protein